MPSKKIWNLINFPNNVIMNNVFQINPCYILIPFLRYLIALKTFYSFMLLIYYQLAIKKSDSQQTVERDEKCLDNHSVFPIRFSPTDCTIFAERNIGTKPNRNVCFYTDGEIEKLNQRCCVPCFRIYVPWPTKIKNSILRAGGN